MKKIILVATFIILAGMNGLFAQIVINPIPSYNYLLTEPNTAFLEVQTHITPGHEKRDMDVTISSSSTHPGLVYAVVRVVKANGHVVKGPYTIFLDRLLSVPIDHSSWGVLITCNWNVNASVWIED